MSQRETVLNMDWYFSIVVRNTTGVGAGLRRHASSLCEVRYKEVLYAESGAV